jgi:DNA end-binding protein Ku
MLGCGFLIATLAVPGDSPNAPRELERIPQALPGLLPVYLSPATTESKRIRLNQLNAETGNRLKQQLIDSETGEVVERDQIAKGYEFERGRYVTLDDDELKALQIESSKIIDLSQFVSRDEVDPVYLDAPYYVYPDGALATEAFRVIGEAMAAKGLVGLGRVTITSRERLVLTEPRGAGLLMWTLRSADEVRAAEFGKADGGEVDPDMLAIAETIIERRKAGFDPASFRDRYQDALRELVESKATGVARAPQEVAAPPKVINLMDALKRSLAQVSESTAPARADPAKPKRGKAAAPDRRQAALLMPVSGGRKRKEPVTEKPTAATAPKSRKKA